MHDLSEWNGPGQTVIVENERIPVTTASVLKPIEFTLVTMQLGPGSV